MTTTLERSLDQQPTPTTVTGVLDITRQGHGALRTDGGHPSPVDVQVSAGLVRRYGLRRGDLVQGPCDRARSLTAVERVNGRTPQALRDRPHFADLTPSTPGSGCAWRRPAAVRRRASSISSPRSARDSAG